MGTMRSNPNPCHNQYFTTKLNFSSHISSYFLAFLLNPTNQQQNLCGTDGRRILVADPSSCHKYLLCRWDFSSNPPRLMSVHQNDCREFGSNHFQTSSDGTTGICVTNNSICSDPLGLCPPASQHDIMVIFI